MVMAVEPVALRAIAPEVARYLMASLPRLDDGTGWDHRFSTAYQIGCEALAKLGFARETDWGALGRADPVLPDVLPRWDDVCIAVLRLARQQKCLGYLRRDGTAEPQRTGTFVIRRAVPVPPRVPNIAAAQGLGPALADEQTLRVLECLWLVQGNAWTTAAETVLWRCQPQEWDMSCETDHRFAAAVAQAVASMPDDLRAEIAGLATVTEAHLQANVAYSARLHESYLKTRRESGRRSPDPVAAARRSVALRRQHALDRLFVLRWRLADGWLTGAETGRALEIFNDPLAMAMRRAVVRRLHPDSPVSTA